MHEVVSKLTIKESRASIPNGCLFFFLPEKEVGGYIVQEHRDYSGFMADTVTIRRACNMEPSNCPALDGFMCRAKLKQNYWGVTGQAVECGNLLEEIQWKAQRENATSSNTAIDDSDGLHL